MATLKDSCFLVHSLASEDDQQLIGNIQLHDTLIIGSEGLKQFIASEHPLKRQPDTWHHGAYVGMFDAGDHWLVRTDLFGQELIYFYQDEDRWLIANSLFALQQEVRQLGWALTPNIAGIQAFGQHAWSVQAAIRETVFEQVHLLNNNEYICINKADRKVKVHNWPMAQILSIGADSNCKEQIQLGIDFATNTLQAFTQIGPDFQIICQVSGGHDSRTCFALLSKLSNPLRNVFVQSNTQSPDELVVARQVAQTKNMTVNHFKLQSRKFLSADDIYAAWQYGSWGSYLPIYLPTYAEPNFGIQVKGDLAISSHPTFYGKSYADFRSRVSRLNKNDSTRKQLLASVDQFESELSSQGYNSANAKAFLYFCFRSRFHAGRRWLRRFNKLGNVHTPLMNVHFTRAVLYAQQEGLSMRELKTNLLLAIDRQIALLPYSHEGKNITPEALANAFFSESVTPKQQTMKVYFDRAEMSQPLSTGYAKKANHQDFVTRLVDDFNRVKAKLAALTWFDQSLLEKAEIEIRQSRSLAHNYRATALCMNTAFACGFFLE